MAVLENLTIMFTDIVGFSDLVSKLSRRDSEQLLKTHDQVLKKIIKRFAGRVVKCIGDSFLVVFRSPTDAVLCGMAIQDVIWELNQRRLIDDELSLRVAINSGEVRLTKRDVFGDAVNIASRLEEVAEPGSVFLTESVYLSMNKSEASLDLIGEFEFKGVDNPVRVYQAKCSQRFVQLTNHAGAEVDAQLFPHGGAHLHPRAQRNRLSPWIKIFAATSVLALTITLTWWFTSMFSTVQQQDKVLVEYNNTPQTTVSAEAVDILDPQFIVDSQLKNKAQPLLEAQNYLALKKFTQEYGKQYTHNAYLKLINGHISIYFKNYSEAIEYYQSAFELDPSLAKDPLAAKNLVYLLDKQRVEANKVIALYMTPELVTHLGKRSGQPGLKGRYDAFYLLKDSGNTQAIDLVGLNIWDLRELETCQLKKVAVIELKRLNDPRALAVLEELVSIGFFKRLKLSCLQKDALIAIESLRKQN